MIKKNIKNGFGIIEIIISVVVMATVIYGVLGAFNYYIKSSNLNVDKIRATYLLEEGIEAIRFLRDENWDGNIASLPVYTPYFLELDGTVWKPTMTPEVIDIFSRSFKLGDVYRRDSDDDIIASTSAEAKTLDPDTKQVFVNVSWGDEELEATTYLTNILSE